MRHLSCVFYVEIIIMIVNRKNTDTKPNQTTKNTWLELFPLKMVHDFYFVFFSRRRHCCFWFILIYPLYLRFSLVIRFPFSSCDLSVCVCYMMYVYWHKSVFFRTFKENLNEISTHNPSLGLSNKSTHNSYIVVKHCLGIQTLDTIFDRP